jgi:hypothetical protein
MTERALYLVRLQAEQVPDAGNVQKLSLPEPLTEMLDSEGWQVMSHELAIPNFDGGMILSLYCEREAPGTTRVTA